MVEPTRPPLAPRYWAGWCLVGLIQFSHLLLPRRLRRIVGRGLGSLAWHFNRTPRRVALINLERCRPALDATAREALLREHFKLMGQGIWDYPLAWFGSRRRLEREVAIEGLEHLTAAREAGHPVILMVAHTAALDIAPPRLAMEVPMAGPYNPFGNVLADWLIGHGRSRFGNRPISRESGLRGLLRALRDGGVLYYLADEDYGRERSVFVPLFGQSKATLPIIGRLAGASGAVVLPTMTVYDAATSCYRVILDPPLADFPTGDPARDARRMNEALESQITRHPAHYLWTLKLFRTRPEGEENWY
ncbi:LpxL/LpxP family acyltransferase [Acidihalobacter yilgarnensis]|uniref:LpxL/LpxP family acyltransferase n=1 Tax=Acidihalobacter yilgarnensis TaxID=2819280 RepID=UPI0018D38CDB|nr:lipid A biosynthesis acyltransferase [Acidihalobacter yilgarnensis]